MKVLEQQLELVPEDVRARILLAADYGSLGREQDAVRHLQMAVALRPGDASILYNAACTYGVLGRKAETMEMLMRAKEAGYANVDWIRKDPDLACVQDTPEFKALFGT
jgi:non-specific serine/threonine protein kinase